MTNEIEIKLRLLPKHVGRLKRSTFLRSQARGRARGRRLLTVYFDTPLLELNSAGAVLRVRNLGRRRIQTIKLRASGDMGLQTLREIESEIQGDAPDLMRIPDIQVQTWIRDRVASGTLSPVFTTELMRTVWPISYHESEIEVALDLGEIRAGDRHLPISEVELELKSGLPEHLVELALMLHHEVPVAWEYDTKAARGYRLAVDEPPQPERGQKIAISDDMSGRLAFTTIAQSCLRQIRVNEGCARLGIDIEGVHQLRIGVRRLRALVGVFRKEIATEIGNYFAGELDWLQTQFGGARDWDVFIGESLERLRMRLPGDSCVAAMLRSAVMLREESYTSLRTTLNDSRYADFLLRLQLALMDGRWAAADGGGALDQPVTQFAKRALKKRYKKLQAIGGKAAELPEHDLHRLRIAAKKLRYTAEFFQTLYPRKPAERFIAALADLQDHLGSINDALVSRQLLHSLEHRIAANDVEDARHASGMILGWHAARIDHDLADLGSIWHKLLGRPPFWIKVAR